MSENTLNAKKQYQKKIAILQSNYIPWKGYFDIIRSVDCFVFYDEVQYTRRDFRNRNLIKTANGPLWLTIPVESKGKYSQKICDTKVSDVTWCKSHFKTICQNYSKAPHFGEIKILLEEIFDRASSEFFLSKINYLFVESILKYLNINTKLFWSMDVPQSAFGQNERLVEITKHFGGDLYVSGPSAMDYINTEMFHNEGIDVKFVNYSGYPDYPQLYGPFLPNVSIIDLMMNLGNQAVNSMKILA